MRTGIIAYLNQKLCTEEYSAYLNQYTLAGLHKVVGEWVGGKTKTKLMLDSTQVKIEDEVGVELGNYIAGIPKNGRK